MLLHCVFCNFDPRHEADARAEMVGAFAELLPLVDGMLSYEAGANLDFEAKSPDHSHGFVIKFRDRAAHLAYERHPRHVELGGKLVSMCVGGADGIVVYDLEVG